MWLCYQKNKKEAFGLFSYEDQKGIIHLAFNRIKKFHLKQKFSSFRFKDKYKND